MKNNSNNVWYPNHMHYGNGWLYHTSTLHGHTLNHFHSIFDVKRFNVFAFFSSLHLFVYNETILSSASSFSSASMFLSFLFFAVQSSLLLDENESVHLNSGKHVEGLLSSVPKTKSEPHSVIMIQLVRFEHTHIHHAIHSGTSIYLNRKSTATTRKDCSIERGYYE